MKHGRRHDKLKQQAYKARSKAPGYATEFDAIPVEETGSWKAPPEARLEPAEADNVRRRINKKALNALKYAGVTIDDDGEKSGS